MFTDTNWGGGTRNYYKFMRTDGQVASMPYAAPWNNQYEGLRVDIPVDMMVVEHTIFCGHDLGIRIYLHTSHAPKWLTA